MILLALADLGLLGVRLWPWQDAMSLPGNGTSALDPAITLVGYIGLCIWIGSSPTEEQRKSLFSTAVLGVVGGLFLVAHVVFAARPESVNTGSPGAIQIALIVCASIVVGVSGLRSARSGNTLGFSTVCGVWAAMAASLIGCLAILCQTWFAASAGESNDAWKQYEGLAIGTPATQALVHALAGISGFLLLGPLVGCMMGAIFASVGSPKKG